MTLLSHFVPSAVCTVASHCHHLFFCCSQGAHGHLLLLFQDWLLETWGCLLSLSREAVELKLRATVEELRRRTKQDFFNTFVDESQAGMRTMDGYFPSRDGKEGRPLLNSWVRSLHHSVFAHFHFNLTGTSWKNLSVPMARLTLLTFICSILLSAYQASVCSTAILGPCQLSLKSVYICRPFSSH